MKTLQTKTVDFGKYAAPSATLSAMLILVINSGWTPEEIIVMTSGTGLIINGLLVIGVHFLRRFKVL